MYCGDETGSFIGDIGSHTARFGYGGDNAPTFVVPSIVAQDDNGTKSIPTSCYNSRGDGNTQYKTPMRMPECPSPPQPVTDPVQYLQQGDSIQDWDAFEHTWMSAIDALYVKDALKHTTGGGRPSPSTDVTSRTVGASGIQSSAIRSEPSAGDSKCVHPVLVVLPGSTHFVGGSDSTPARTSAAAKSRELLRLTEVMMETIGAGALFVAPTPMLAAFAHGRQTCLVVDAGAGGTRVTPVVDGLVLQQAQRRTGRGGDWLSACLWQALLQAGGGGGGEQTTTAPSPTPRYQLRTVAATAKGGSSCNVFHRWAMHDLMYELRTSEHVDLPPWWYDPTVPFVYPDQGCSSSATSNSGDMEVESTKHHELPDGTVIDLTNRVGKDVCRVPELLFSECCPFQDHLSTEQLASSQAILAQHASLSNLPLHKLVHSSLSAVSDVDVRKDLAATIVLTGGLSVLKNLEKRLSLELPRITSAAYKPKVLASRYDVERQCAAWIGGSVLTSLGSFQQLWLSKAEYEEYGGTLAIQRFP